MLTFYIKTPTKIFDMLGKTIYQPKPGEVAPTKQQLDHIDHLKDTL